MVDPIDPNSPFQPIGISVPNIPVQPIGYDTAREIMKRLGNTRKFLCLLIFTCDKLIGVKYVSKMFRGF